VTAIPSQFQAALRRRISHAANRFITMTAAAAVRMDEADENPGVCLVCARLFYKNNHLVRLQCSPGCDPEIAPPHA
jgi:hypothetical protein